jgi:hypothetical protein
MEAAVYDPPMPKLRRRPDRRARLRSQVVEHQDIARRAYALFVARGSQHGWDVDDWLTAERELTGRLADEVHASAA